MVAVFWTNSDSSMLSGDDSEDREAAEDRRDADRQRHQRGDEPPKSASSTSRISGRVSISACARPDSLSALTSPQNDAVPTSETSRPSGANFAARSCWRCGRNCRAMPSSTPRPRTSREVEPSCPTNSARTGPVVERRIPQPAGDLELLGGGHPSMARRAAARSPGWLLAYQRSWTTTVMLSRRGRLEAVPERDVTSSLSDPGRYQPPPRAGRQGSAEHPGDAEEDDRPRPRRR